MVFLLLCDVPGHRLHLRLTYRESAVTRLPEEAIDALLLHPLRGTLLHLLDHVSHSPGSCERQQRMDVIRCAARLNRRAADVPENPGYVSVQQRSGFAID